VKFFPLEPNWTQVASTSPSVDAPDISESETEQVRTKITIDD